VKSLLESFNQLKAKVVDFVERLEPKLQTLIEDFDSLKELMEDIKNLLDNFVEAVRKAVEKAVEEQLPLISNSISDKIVGESYYKWSSTNTFLPTLVFIFREDVIGGRRAQIKVRINVPSEEFTNRMVEALKRRVETLEEQVGSMEQSEEITSVEIKTSRRRSSLCLYQRSTRLSKPCAASPSVGSTL